MRALAVTTLPDRAKALPDTPAVAGFLPGYSVYAMGRHVCAGPRLPARSSTSSMPDEKPTLRAPGMPSAALPTSERRPSPDRRPFGKRIADDTEKWRKVIEFAGIKPV